MRKDLERRIKKRIVEIDAINKQIAELETEKASVRARIDELESILRALPKDGTETDPEKGLRIGTDVYNAHEVLLQARQPLHITELLMRMGMEPTKRVKNSVSSQISAYFRRGEIFTRPKPNTFGLIDYGQEPISKEQEDILEAQSRDLEYESPIRSFDDIPF